MADLSGTVSSDLASYYEFVAAQTHKWVDPLTQEQFWRNPYTYGNTVGHLILHMTGNLNYYIGARVAETGYIRNRDREFTETEKPEKGKVLEAFDRTIAMVVATIRKQEPADWLKSYSAEREPEAAERFMIFLRCAGHAYHHVGQIIFLNKELTKQAEPRAAAAPATP
ncbi:MAG: DinB family protein [Candidatus Acidiferrales bacterium]